MCELAVIRFGVAFCYIPNILAVENRLALTVRSFRVDEADVVGFCVLCWFTHRRVA